MRALRIPSKAQLDLVDTPTLVDALARRSEAIVCVVMRPQRPGVANTYVQTHTHPQLPNPKAALECLIEVAQHHMNSEE